MSNVKTLKFIHSMSKKEYLESALNNGLLLTDHKVKFHPIKDRNILESLVNNEIMFTLKQRLLEIGKPWEFVEGERRKIIFSGIGFIRGSIPMLCFSEVPDGRNIQYHQLNFGAYGLVVKRQWLENNEADRVLYIGQDSPISRHLFRNLANLRIANLFFDTKSNLILFNNSCFSALLDMIAFIEIREHLEEFEWRIVGNPGFMKEKRDLEKRLVIGLEDIEYILVQNSEDIKFFEKLIDNLAIVQGTQNIPKVLCQPEVIPHT
jgi:hypothetical protein